MSNDAIITKTKENIEAVISSNGESHLDTQLLESMISKLKYDSSLFVNPSTGGSSDSVIITLLPPSINALKLSAITPLPYLDVLVDLVEALLSRKSLAEVLVYISAEDLLAGVKSSQVPSLQAVAIEQISKAEPNDLEKIPQFITALVEQLADRANERTQPIESCLQKIIKTIRQDVSKFLLSGEPLAIFKQMKESTDAIVVGRVLEVMKDIVCIIPEPSSEYKLQTDAVKANALQFFKFPKTTFDPEKWDSLFVATIFQMYRQILVSPHQPSPNVLFNSSTGILDELEIVGLLFSKRTELTYIEVRMLLLSDIVGIFAALSRSSNEQVVEFFHTFDDKYKIIESVAGGENTQDPDLVSEYQLVFTMLSPAYLLKYYSSNLKSIRFNAGNVSVLRNILGYGPSFEYMEASQSDFINGIVDYQDKMFVLTGILQSKEGRNTLFHEWPQVMNLIIDPDSVVSSPTTVELRRKVLETLVELLPHELGIWYGGVKEAYREIIFGRPRGGPGVAVAQKTF